MTCIGTTSAVLVLTLLACSPAPNDVSTDSAAPTSSNAEATSSPYERFRERMDAGASCAELFGRRNALKPSDPVVKKINEDLGRIGCLSSSSERQKPRGGGLDLYSLNYKSSYMVCEHDPEETFRQAGTNDPGEASSWMASSSRAGEAYDGAYDGCLDALTGQPSKFE